MLLTTKAENVLFILPCQKKQKQNLPAAELLHNHVVDLVEF